MKRDMDLVRKILFVLQDKTYLVASFDGVEIDGYDSRVVAYHLSILSDSPYVVGQLSSRGIMSHYRLTWQGHEFLDSVGDEGRWRKIKEVSKDVGGFSFDMIAKIASDLIIKAVSGQIGI